MVDKINSGKGSTQKQHNLVDVEYIARLIQSMHSDTLKAVFEFGKQTGHGEGFEEGYFTGYSDAEHMHHKKEA